MGGVAGIGVGRVRAKSNPSAVVAYDWAFIRDFDANISETDGFSRVEQNALCIRDLEDTALSVIPQKYLDVAVLVPWIVSRDVSGGLEHDETTVAAHRSENARCVRIGKLADKCIGLTEGCGSHQKGDYKSK